MWHLCRATLSSVIPEQLIFKLFPSRKCSGEFSSELIIWLKIPFNVCFVANNEVAFKTSNRFAFLLQIWIWSGDCFLLNICWKYPITSLLSQIDGFACFYQLSICKFYEWKLYCFFWLFMLFCYFGTLNWRHKICGIKQCILTSCRCFWFKLEHFSLNLLQI